MMGDGGAQFNFHNQIEGGQVNQGQTVNATQNINDGVSIEELERRLLSQLADAINKDTTVLPSDSFDKQIDIVDPLLTVADNPQSITEPECKSLLNRLSPYSEVIKKVVVAFSLGALKALATRNPLICGLLAALEVIDQNGNN